MRLNKIISIIFVIILVFMLFISACASTTNTNNTDNSEEIDLTDVSDELYLEDEYYIGKGVTAKLLEEYPVLENKEVNKYLRFIGVTISAVSYSSDDVYKNYSFVMLDTDEQIAYSAPSGFILISKGMMKACNNEDEFAGIIAHQIGLNIGKYPIKSLPAELKKKINYALMNSKKDMMEEVYNDAMNGVYDYIINGYDVEAHLEADKKATRMLYEVGYSVEAFKVIIKQLTPDGYNYPESSMPTIEDRLSAIAGIMTNLGEDNSIKPERTKRFNQMLTKLK